jgi:hypothetical protein
MMRHSYRMAIMKVIHAEYVRKTIVNVTYKRETRVLRNVAWLLESLVLITRLILESIHSAL